MDRFLKYCIIYGLIGFSLYVLDVKSIANSLVSIAKSLQEISKHLGG